jgi:hypothetical protein
MDFLVSEAKRHRTKHNRPHRSDATHVLGGWEVEFQEEPETDLVRQ